MKKRDVRNGLTMLAVGLSVAIPFGKVAPVLPDLNIFLDVELSTGGVLMSVYSAASILAAIILGFLTRRIGYRNAFMPAGLALSAAGGLLNLLIDAPSASLFYPLLYLGRFLEGFGFGVVEVCGPVVISALSGRNRGVLLGAWSATVPLGFALATCLSAAFAPTLGWKSVWVASVVATLAGLCLCRFAPLGSSLGRNGEESRPVNREAAVGRGVAVMAVLLALQYCVFNFGVDSYNEFSLTYLDLSVGYGYGYAAGVSIALFTAMIGGSFAGGLLFKSGGRPPGARLLALYLLMVAGFALVFKIDGPAVPVALYYVATAFVYGMLPVAFIFCASYISSTPDETSTSMAVLVCGQNIGSLCGPAVTGLVISEYGWNAATRCILVVGLIGLAACLVFVYCLRKRWC